MTDYCASNLARPNITQTWIFDAVQNKLVPHAMSGNFTYNVNHNQFDIGIRTCYKSVSVVTSSSNPLTVSSGGLYIANDNTTRVQFILPLASGSMIAGDCFRFAGFGSAGFSVAVVSPGQGQVIYLGGVFHIIQNLDQYAQVSFQSNQNFTNNFFEAFSVQGRFSGT